MSRNNLNLLPKCKGARSKDTRVRAPNEPRIIVAPFHAPLAYRRHLFVSANAIAKGGRADTDKLREYVRVVWSICIGRYADLLRREIIGERHVTDHASRGTWITHVESWKDRKREDRCVTYASIVIYRTISLTWKIEPVVSRDKRRRKRNFKD